MTANNASHQRRHLKVASMTKAFCGLVMASVRQTKQPVAHPYLLGYYEAWLKSGRRLPMPRGLLHCATGLQGLVPVGDGVSELRIHYGPGYRIYLTKQGDAVDILLAGGVKSTQDMDIRLAKDLARNL
jgi:putative addiction module killer protein